MDGPTYERWVAGRTVETDRPKGRLRTDDQAVRFVEVTVNGPKTWSLAAAAGPGGRGGLRRRPGPRRVADRGLAGLACDDPGGAAGPAGAGAGGGDRGRGGPPLHLTGRGPAPTSPPADQRPGLGGRVGGGVCTRSGCGTAWRRSTGSDTPRSCATRSSGPPWPPTATPWTRRPGEIAELAGYVGAFSARAKQIETHVDSYEADWRSEHPGEEPGRSCGGPGTGGALGDGAARQGGARLRGRS